MAIDFPASPTNGQVYANYIYDSSITAWRNVNTDTGIGTLNTMGLKNVVPTSVSVGSGSASTNSNGTVTLSGASSISLNGVFTSTYKNYKILLTNSAGTVNASNYIRMRNAGSDLAGATSYIYSGIEMATSGSTVGGKSLNGGTSLFYSYSYTTYGSDVIIDIKNPAVALETMFSISALSQLSSGNYVHFLNGRTNGAASAYDGISFFPDSGTFSGTIQVFGYTN